MFSETIKMTDFITDQKFLELVERDFPHLLKPQWDYDIIVREPEKQEFSRADGLPLSQGGTIGRGDIIFSSINFGRPNIFLFIGARFDLEDSFASHLRKMAYDRAFDYEGAHSVDLWRLGKRGGGYGRQDTPFIEIPLKEDLESTKADLLHRYAKAKLYLGIIDSPEFRNLVEESRLRTQSSLTGLIETFSI